MTTLVQIENLTKHFIEGDQTRAILDDACAAFNEGEFIAIRGRSGSGKSTLLNLIGAIDSPTRGEQQRVAIARALIQNPRLVLADEPTGNLNDATSNAVMNLLNQMTHQAGKTLIMVTHSRRIAAQADAVLTIEGRKIVPMKEMIKEKVEA